jgi:hypothetical protein
MGSKVLNHDIKEGYKYIYLAHSKDLISVSAVDQNLFYTSSVDLTVRLWDLRVSGSVKLITDPAWKSSK